MKVSRPTRNGAVLAAVAALLILAVQVVLQLLSTLVTATVFISSAPGDYLFSYAIPGYLFSAILSWLPFAIGVFLVFWLLAPIAAAPRLGSIVARCLLALAGGTIVVFFAYLSAALFSQVSSSEGMVFGWASAVIGSVVSGLDSVVGYALYNALSGAIALVPLTVLAGVLTWVWSRERAAHAASRAAVADV